MNFFRGLENLKKNCNFRDHTAEECGNKAMRDAFISGLSSHSILRQLLENKTLDLQTTYTQASALGLVQQNKKWYTTSEAQLATLVNREPPKIVYVPSVKPEEQTMAVAYQVKCKCFFCGFPYHSQDHCPAHMATCKKCSKKKKKKKKKGS